MIYTKISAEDLQRAVELCAPNAAKKYPIFTKIFLTKEHSDIERLITIVHGAAHILWEYDELGSEELRALRKVLSDYVLKGTI